MKKKILIIVITSVVLTILLSSGTLALFLRTNSFSGIVSSKEFYFESDLLDTDNPIYELNAGTKSFSFTIMNYEDELRYSKIKLNVIIENDNPDINVKIESEDTLSTTLEEGQLSKKVVTLSNLEDGKTYTVTATATSGYKKVLKATITVRSQEKLIYKYIDNSDPNFLYITVWSTFSQGDVKVTFNEVDIVPDKTWPTLNDISIDATTFNVSVEENSSYVYRFLKKSTFNDTQLSKISLTINDEELTEKAPS